MACIPINGKFLNSRHCVDTFLLETLLKIKAIAPLFIRPIIPYTIQPQKWCAGQLTRQLCSLFNVPEYKLILGYFFQKPEGICKLCIFLVEIHQRLNTCGNIRDAIALLGVTDKSEFVLCTKGVVRMDKANQTLKIKCSVLQEIEVQRLSSRQLLYGHNLLENI